MGGSVPFSKTDRESARGRGRKEDKKRHRESARGREGKNRGED